MAKRYELSDEAWAVVADLFTETHGRERPRLSDRLMLDGVLWTLCSGAAWRVMPERFGPWSTVYQRFRGWRNQGTFDQMLKRLHLRLNEQGLIDLQTWMIDSTAVRATQASSGAEKIRPQTFRKFLQQCPFLRQHDPKHRSGRWRHITRWLLLTRNEKWLRATR